MALIPAVCSLIGITLIGIRIPTADVIRAPFLEALLSGAVGYALGLAGVFIGGWVVNLLAPVFNSKPDLNSAMKVIIYSLTPVRLVWVFSLVPGLGILAILGLYGIYLLALGLPVVMETPPNKVVLYTIAILVASLVINMILALIIGGLFYGPMFMRMKAI